MTHPEDTAIIERDLGAVDAALSGAGASHPDSAARELQELALTLRADSPAPDPSFTRELGARVEAGFTQERGSRRWRARLPRVNLLPLGGALASLLVVVVIVFAAGGPPRGGGDDDAGAGGGSVAESARAPEGSARDSGGGAERTLTPPPPDQPGFAPRQRQRRIERSIAMTLTAPDDDIPALAEGVSRVAARYGGFVLSSELDTSDDGATGSYELRIPSNRLQSALRALARLGTVSSQSQSGQDVTRDYVTAADRLEAARAERRSLLRRLERAQGNAQAEALRARLDLVAGEINGLRSQLRDLRLRTDYAIVAVDLVGEQGNSSSGAAGGSFDDALADAGDLLVGFAGVLIRVLAVALPLGLMGALGWLVISAARRRRRESALA
jgi:hypothetical protein